MRKLYFILLTGLITSSVFAQSPAKMSYQAIIRNSSNQLVTNTAVGMKISILQGSATGTVVYTETQTPTTNANGLVTLEIGNGEGFININWTSGSSYFIKTETDPTGGTNYTITGSSQLLSVPFALYSLMAGNGFSGNYNDLTNKPVGNSLGDIQYWNGTSWEILPRGSNGQVLSISSSNIPLWINASAANLLAPTVTILPATNLQSTPTLNAKVNANGLSTTVVFEWGLTTDYDNSRIIYGNKDADSDDPSAELLIGNSDVAVSVIPDYLKPNTTYHYRVKATNSVNTSYSSDMTFTTTLFAPQVGIGYAEFIKQTSASFDCNINSNGGSPIIARGVCWSTTPNPTVANNFTSNGLGVGSYGSYITGLVRATKYYVRAYATNSIGTSYSVERNFTTQSGLASIYTKSASFISANSATVGGSIYSDGSSAVTARGVCWSTSANPTIADSKTIDGSGVGDFTSSINGLTLGLTYFVRAYATNSLGTAYGDEISFTTLIVTLPTITTADVSSISQTNAYSGGYVIDNGGGTLSTCGVCWSTSANPTISDSKTDDNFHGPRSNFSSRITELMANTTYYVRAYATNSAGTAYGNQVSFTTLTVSTPTLSTLYLSSIKGNTAESQCEMLNNGGSTITVRGFCWSTSENPTIAYSKTEEYGSSSYLYSIITGLTPNTNYYVRAYATNSIGTAYSNQVSFTTKEVTLPTVTTKNVSSITQTTATSGFNLANDGNGTITARGVCWSTSENPTIANSKTEDYIYSSESHITGLTLNTTYYVRAYATNSAGTAYGNQVTFTTLNVGLPTVTTYDVNSITGTTADGGGYINNNGGATVTAQGLCWSTTANPTIVNYKTTESLLYSSFSSNITGLTSNTKYYVRAYATNSAGTAYGNEVSFTTLLITVPAITTTAITSIAQTTAVSGGFITSNGGLTITEQGVCWSTTANPTIAANKVSDIGMGSSFSSNIAGLTANTTYYVRAYATNSLGTGYGNEASFKTLAVALPTVTTNIASGITKTTAISGGNVTNDGGATVTVRGVCWSTSASPTIANSKTTNNAGRGEFSSSIASLTANTTYYLRAYATNSIGTAYGDEISFKTASALIGTSNYGGIIAYIFQPGDPGYVAGETHGLVVAPSDQGADIVWWNGSNIETGATATALGTGNANTNLIVSSQGPGTYAAKLCSDLVLGGYSDWYLPSKDELNMLYANRVDIGGLSSYYWSSSEYSKEETWILYFNKGNLTHSGKSATFYVRAVRSF